MHLLISPAHNTLFSYQYVRIVDLYVPSYSALHIFVVWWSNYSMMLTETNANIYLCTMYDDEMKDLMS